ncbi:bifunctional DNA-formamidopyrimidine glycosylase/DNA-(apurinic or apyrimidinic site) lyase [Desulfolithobacter dissulfuricans]|uniref:bifunctional DNA-formamidopyrimidine glycosylase/DNA-(apurinic or apyrimidinic site) lyase n=1 Tax=Desulfolithobacter dissulfuricans TaxID=2795293 RepID=UPI00227937DB|nr:bifunctional DNA-formamidopyrimidine glycosylase/DNA-(apurinic or apyrimidinic site) lyase [Desulfolithobacter dissulfuricans]
MPELPEVEVTRRGLLPHLPDRRVVRVRWGDKPLRFPIPGELLEREISGQRIETIDRRAKYLLLRMSNKAVLVIHLGMTGRLGLFPAASPRERHDHLRLLLDNDLELRLNDSRRFGSVEVWPGKHAREMEDDFSSSRGLEPLERGFTGEALAHLATGRRQPVKNFLMDSRRVAGIGNIYANEILFAARIHPATPVNLLDPEQWEQIAGATPEILRAAIRAGGSTISDFLGSSGKPGYFQLQLSVYDRAGDPCPHCRSPIEKTALGGRATWFCPSCQGMKPQG